jgi:hypothetical protein
MFTLSIIGCDDTPAPTTYIPGTTEISEAFDSSTAGEITGRVVWDGPIPLVPPIRAPIAPGGPAAKSPRRDWPNPNAPHIEADPENQAVEGAVVFLRGVDPKRARPWDHPMVHVALRDHLIRIDQGETESNVGFVRRGDEIEIVSRQDVFESLRGRGAAFFALPFMDRDEPRRRHLDRNGVVELSSAVGHIWARAYLFVDEHPYYARTDEAGRFTLPRVPPGDYELVCWLPNWNAVDRELDADSWQVTRVEFGKPFETTRKLSVTENKITNAEIVLSGLR